MFVTPQYNWGYPAPLKNAIDYLYNEWKGKPALVVSYGGHGGGKANGQLREVLRGVRMHVCEKGVELGFGESGDGRGTREILGIASRGQGLGLDGGSEGGMWAGKRGHIGSGFEEVLRRCAGKVVE